MNWLLPLIFSLAPAQDAERLAFVAQAMHAVSDSHEVFCGPRAHEANALALAVIASHESGYSEDVQACERTGDGGASISLWQLHRGTGWTTKAERLQICEDTELAAWLALEHLARFRRAGTVRGMFAGYHMGDYRARSEASDSMSVAFGWHAGRLGMTIRAVGPCLEAR